MDNNLCHCGNLPEGRWLIHTTSDDDGVPERDIEGNFCNDCIVYYVTKLKYKVKKIS